MKKGQKSNFLAFFTVFIDFFTILLARWTSENPQRVKCSATSMVKETIIHSSWSVLMTL